MFNYIASFIIMSLGMYGVITSRNLVKKMLCLSVVQTSVLLFYVTLSKVQGGNIPVLTCLNYEDCPVIYANPVPQVLMLTAIVVGVSTLALGLALAIKIESIYGTIEENELPI